MDRLIFHIDVNSAYLSWEAVRHLQKTGEDLRIIPSAVGGNPEKRTGIILAKSIPAKKLGVKTGEPVSMALRKCPDLILVPPDFSLYEKNSKAFMDICRKYAPIVEKFSIDECFLDMTGTSLLYPDPIEIAHHIKNEIRDTLGFTVNVGIGENKLLAKMASDFEKPDRVHTLFRHERPEKFWPLPIGDLFMTGKATAETLKKHNIHTIGDAKNAGSPALCAMLGPRHGAQLFARASGEDDSPVLAEPEEAKGYSISTTLEEDIKTAEDAKQVLLALADSVSARMRADGMQCSTVTVTIRSTEFKNRSHGETLSFPTDVTMEIYTHACRLFDAVWDKVTPLRLLGIALTNLEKEDGAQLTFFTDEKREKEGKMDKAVDRIRKRFGTGKVVRGGIYKTDLSVGRKYKAQLENKKGL